MLLRNFRKSLIDSRSVLPPTFLLPLRRQLTTVSSRVDNVEEPGEPSRLQDRPNLRNRQSQSYNPAGTPTASYAPATHSQSLQSWSLSDSVRAFLPLLRAQPPHYITINIYGRPFLVTQGDLLRLPFRIPGLRPGDVLRLNKATHIGSRDFTLRAPPPVRGEVEVRHQVAKGGYLDDRLFICRATVVAEESEPLRIMEKTKRRQRHVKHVKSKHRYTFLRISEVTLNSLEDIEGTE